MKQLPLIVALLLVLAIALFLQFRPESRPETSTFTHTFEPEWTLHEDATVSFQHPVGLPGTYMKAIDWPPKVARADEYICVAEKTEMGETREMVVNDHRYCVTTSAEGAAGSVYTDYRYLAEREGEAFVVTFSVKEVQCANYDEPQKTACITERESFSIDSMAVRIAESIAFK
ncbi:MAG TPA: hypothetical protein VF696_02530 [Candidatus Paceibacterota bacterium]|jgi:hypothetical protein